ncbi:hypothetical protein GGS23DRAFT_544799 [Durotheca rogersii]|uniref:uncharacterized protein n=1 Tax=Durotheca rogersii TaxID=419775 RepID=UPI002220CA30|nr:uncharacterized protein GGS23DRAFT_544799 [Durotheca rogersii]KAI5868289.1 hypothetical protein GGS23DRAFT_544799 [Durotheca rogersii]
MSSPNRQGEMPLGQVQYHWANPGGPRVNSDQDGDKNGVTSGSAMLLDTPASALSSPVHVSGQIRRSGLTVPLVYNPDDPFIDPTTIRAANIEHQLATVNGGLTWEPDDNFLADARVDNLFFLQKFWKTSIDIFYSNPYDLFTWGLRVNAREHDPVLRDLSDLMAHPIWAGSLALLRFALQRAVCGRVANHLPPFIPASSGVLDQLQKEPPISVAGMDPYEAEAYMSKKIFDTWIGTVSPHRASVIRALLAEMDAYFAQQGPQHNNRHNHNQHPASEWEQHFFVLRSRDVRAVSESLDALCHRGVYDCLTESYASGYFSDVGSWWPLLAPVDQVVLKRWEALSTCCRRRRSAQQLPDVSLSAIDQNYVIYMAAEQLPRYQRTMFQWSELAL